MSAISHMIDPPPAPTAMHGRPGQPRAWLNRACPQCKVPARHYCITQSGKSTAMPHRLRFGHYAD